LQRQFLLRAFRLSSIRQRALARLYQNGRIDQHLQELRRLLKEQATLMSQRLDEHLAEWVSYRMPVAGTTFWLSARQAVDMRQVFQHMLGQRVVIAPGELFSVSGLHQQHLRLSHSFDGQYNLDLALVELAQALKRAQVG